MLIRHYFWTWSIFQKKLVERVKKSLFFSISFDVSLNEVVKKQQTDFVVRYWDCSIQRSCVQYFTSKFPKYCSAEDLNLCYNRIGSKQNDPIFHGWTTRELVTV